MQENKEKEYRIENTIVCKILVWHYYQNNLFTRTYLLLYSAMIVLFYFTTFYDVSIDVFIYFIVITSCMCSKL